MPKILLVDMDGTLFDYEGQLRFDLQRLASPVEPNVFTDRSIDLWDEKYPYIKARSDLIKSVPGWWRTLPKFQLGWDVYWTAMDIGFCCKILTKGPNSKSLAWKEKLECIRDHFGEDMPVDIVGKDKSGVYGRVLVDDYPTYMEDWLKHRPRGLGIMPAHPYNKGYKSPRVIRYDGTNLDQVRKVLQLAYDREQKEDWIKK
jgi:5'-nucleotidase